MQFSKNSGVYLTIATLLLLLPPCVVLMLDWRWLAQPEPYWLLFYYVTETASMPYGIVTGCLLACVVLLYGHLPLKKALLLFVLMAGVILAGQLIKTTIKSWQQAPRPYVVWLQDKGYIDSANIFYQQPRSQRILFLKQQNLTVHIPVWLDQHWQSETGYSFPSGHSIFVASWALMIFNLLLRKKAYIFIAMTMLWAMAVELSRLLLGMHWPQDIILSCLFAWLLVFIASQCWNRWVFEDNIKFNLIKPE